MQPHRGRGTAGRRTLFDPRGRAGIQSKGSCKDEGNDSHPGSNDLFDKITGEKQVECESHGVTHCLQCADCQLKHRLTCISKNLWAKAMMVLQVKRAPETEVKIKIMYTDKNGSAAEQIYDKAQLAELAKLAIGGRTLREFANQSGLSEGFLSRLTTGKLESAPTRRSLTKLTAETSKPQNGITLGAVMAAAGYPYVVATDEEKRLAPGDREAVPTDVLTAAFPAYLAASTLEGSGQLGHRYSSENQREMFVISSRGSKDIVGIPAFCAPDAVEDELRETKRNLLMAYSIFDDDIKDKFVVIMTNQPAIYDGFDKARLVGTGGEFYITLTEDLRNFTQQRPVQTTDINGEPVPNPGGPATYDFTATRD